MFHAPVKRTVPWAMAYSRSVHCLANERFCSTMTRVMPGMARHQARIAITVMTHAVPEREPATIRAALQLVLGFGFESP